MQMISVCWIRPRRKSIPMSSQPRPSKTTCWSGKDKPPISSDRSSRPSLSIRSNRPLPAPPLLLISAPETQFSLFLLNSKRICSWYYSDSIVLDKEQKIAKVKDDKNGKTILLNQSVLEHKNNQIRFKITGQMGPSVIQLGLCNKTIITQKQYKF